MNHKGCCLNILCTASAVGYVSLLILIANLIGLRDACMTLLSVSGWVMERWLRRLYLIPDSLPVWLFLSALYPSCHELSGLAPLYLSAMTLLPWSLWTVD